MSLFWSLCRSLCGSLFKYVVYIYIQRPVPSLAPPSPYDWSCCTFVGLFVGLFSHMWPTCMYRDLQRLLRHYLCAINLVQYFYRSLSRSLFTHVAYVHVQKPATSAAPLSVCDKPRMTYVGLFVGLFSHM